jgi:deoxyribose-phosphate aldolase
VIGFPFGYTSSSAKLAEATAALKEGADEIDMVINVGALKGGDYELVAREIRDASGECKKSRKLLKVIVECCYLSDPEKVRVSQMAEDLGADFIKTSTGFGTGGATAADVALIKQCLTGRAKVKASGGVTTLSKAQEMIRAGAERIGTSSGVAIMDEFLAPRRANLRPTGKRI